MSLPEPGYPLTAAVSPRVQVVDSTSSTNADVLRLAADDPSAWPHLSVLATTDQRAGRGRLDREWVSPAGTALAVTTLCRVPELPVHARGWIPLIAGVALTRAVSAQLQGTTSQAVGMKWPNDVLVDDRKIAGILAEVVPGHFDAIALGSGINTRMPSVPVDTATSFLLLGVQASDDQLLADYLSGLDSLLTQLQSARGDADASGVRAEASAACVTLGSEVSVALPDGAMLCGVAEDIDGEGRLVVRSENAGNEVVAVSAGDVVHVR